MWDIAVENVLFYEVLYAVRLDFGRHMTEKVVLNAFTTAVN